MNQQERFLKLLAKKYPNIQAASSEIINLNAILNLPKGTEHYLSDLHGEFEAFEHIMRNASGVIKKKIDEQFSTALTSSQRRSLATLIYYPEEKLEIIKKEKDNLHDWYKVTLYRLVDICRVVASKYTRSKVRKALPKDFEYIMEELLHEHNDFNNKQQYYEGIIETIIKTERADAFIINLCHLIQRLAVDHLHIIGDIFDRGPRADIVMDCLMEQPNVDIQWGNHDVLWMGAASGSRTLVATVLSNSIRYNNLDVIETGYGISLRPLSVFANEVYKDCDTHCFDIKLTNDDSYSEKDKLLSSRMYKAITMILFKLEGAKVLRRSEFQMEDRALLHRINYEEKTITIGDNVYHLEDCDFPTVDPKHPYELTAEENSVIDQLTESFRQSEKLQRHIRFLYSKGSLYKVHNGNLLLHSCVPMTEDGKLLSFTIGGKRRTGKEFMDYADRTARKAYYDKRGTEEREFGMDFLWWLWAGRNSPIFGRERMATFERRFILDESAQAEPKNAYYSYYNDPAVCNMLLSEFGLHGPHCHIINGHVPVKARKGESPIKGGGKLLVIDGGFSRAYQKTSGIAGYTLLFGSRYYRIVSHQPFAGRQEALKSNHDIDNESVIFETMEERMKVSETDEGVELREQVYDLLRLMDAYRSGAVAENHNY